MSQRVTERVILDTSLTLAWFFADEANPYADSVALLLASGEAIVPSLWPLEVGNALVMGERRKRSTEAQAASFLARLKSLPIVVDSETAGPAWNDTIGLARAHGLSVYDAAYLELAMRRGLPLASLDEKLKKAAVAVGVGLYSVP
jgi:predicted nucleic acid-binding protein